MKVYAKQVLSGDSDTIGGDEVVEASKVFLKGMVALASK